MGETGGRRGARGRETIAQRPGGKLQARRLFNSKAERRTRAGRPRHYRGDPPSLKLRRDCAAIRSLKHVFLRNEPTVFAEFFQCKYLGVYELLPKCEDFLGGFVLENEPTGEGF